MEVEMKKCWLYARTANKNDIALAFQIEKLSDYANKNNLVIAGITAESVAGLNCNRVGLKETLQAIRSNRADTVLVTDLSRIGRSIPDVIEWQSRVCEEGGAVVSMQDNMFNYLKTYELLKLYFEQSCS